MRRLSIWFVAGLVVGAITAFGIAPWWEQQHDWRQDIGSWFVDSDGVGVVGGFLSLMWPFAPVWFMAAIMGLFAGIKQREQLLRTAVALGLGLTVASFIQYYTMPTNSADDLAAVPMAMMNVLGIPVAIVLAMFGRGVSGGKRTAASDQPDATEDAPADEVPADEAHVVAAEEAPAEADPAIEPDLPDEPRA